MIRLPFDTITGSRDLELYHRQIAYEMSVQSRFAEIRFPERYEMRMESGTIFPIIVKVNSGILYCLGFYTPDAEEKRIRWNHFLAASTGDIVLNEPNFVVIPTMTVEAICVAVDNLVRRGVIERFRKVPIYRPKKLSALKGGDYYPWRL